MLKKAFDNVKIEKWKSESGFCLEIASQPFHIVVKGYGFDITNINKPQMQQILSLLSVFFCCCFSIHSFKSAVGTRWEWQHCRLNICRYLLNWQILLRICQFKQYIYKYKDGSLWLLPFYDLIHWPRTKIDILRSQLKLLSHYVRSQDGLKRVNDTWKHCRKHNWPRHWALKLNPQHKYHYEY